MNIAVFLASDLLAGGGFQYEYKVLSMLLDKRQKKYNIIPVTLSGEIYETYRKRGLDVRLVKEKKLANRLREFSRGSVYWKTKLRKYNYHISKIEQFLADELNIDLVYFLSPHPFAVDLVNIPFIITVWDLCHRDFIEFPEVRGDLQFEIREEIYTQSLKKALSIIVDSNKGAENVIRRYNIDEKRVQTFPFIPNFEGRELSVEIDIQKKYDLNRDYVYYPAQFWPHKNHVYILEALRLLKYKENIIIDAVFSGSNKGGLDYITKLANKYEMGDQLHCIGFVDDQEIPWLYKNALALAMPTYFGPTNIPPLEAFFYSCPVCYPDLEGLREQVADAAFLMDLKNPSTLADSLKKIYLKDDVLEKKIEAGKAILENWTDEDFYKKLINLFDEFNYIMRRWKSFDEKSSK